LFAVQTREPAAGWGLGLRRMDGLWIFVGIKGTRKADDKPTLRWRCYMDLGCSFSLSDTLPGQRCRATGDAVWLETRRGDGLLLTWPVARCAGGARSNETSGRVRRGPSALLGRVVRLRRVGEFAIYCRPSTFYREQGSRCCVRDEQQSPAGRPACAI
jgi:hypothetical protein